MRANDVRAHMQTHANARKRTQPHHSHVLQAITAEAARKCEGFGEALAGVEGLEEDDVLMLFLLHLRQGAASRLGHDKTAV